MGWRKPVPRLSPDSSTSSASSSRALRRLSLTIINKEMPPVCGRCNSCTLTPQLTPPDVAASRLARDYGACDQEGKTPGRLCFLGAPSTTTQGLRSVARWQPRGVCDHAGGRARPHGMCSLDMPILSAARCDQCSAPHRLHSRLCLQFPVPPPHTDAEPIECVERTQVQQHATPVITRRASQKSLPKVCGAHCFASSRTKISE